MLPSRDEALALLDRYQATPGRIAHSLTVARFALIIGTRLIARNIPLNLPLIEAAALLHDIRKGYPDHDDAGADLLASLGYPQIAAIVGVHTRLGGRTPAPSEPISEAEVVYIADKSYRGATRVTIEERYAIWLATWKDHPARLQSLTAGENRAKAVRARVEKVLRQPLNDV